MLIISTDSLLVTSRVHVLHAFQKKTEITAKHDLELAKKRLKQLLQEQSK
ncbi:MAG: type II toxin-antitoxin system RelE/ParE family toxin [Enterobacterales bacterium]|nr:type II toxin-antitoxin system RelE/ParE family toxin [Enterobacterales bacterium]